MKLRTSQHLTGIILAIVAVTAIAFYLQAEAKKPETLMSKIFSCVDD